MKITVPLQSQHRGMEQLVARWAHNPKVAGSSPAPATPKATFLSGFLFLVQHRYKKHLIYLRL
jgi:hypothetical protein